MKAAVTIKEATAHFAANRETIPVHRMPRGDYAFEVAPENHLYLVVEAKGSGIFLARLGPKLMKLRPLSEEEQQAARAFAQKRLEEAGLLQN
ncbi:MAG: hypothetical protein AB1330_05305 [Bacillota bacterium]|jgi:hypothetical protein